MKYADLHSDYLYKLKNKGSDGIYQSGLDQLLSGDCLFQTFAILFNRLKITNISIYYNEMLGLFNHFLAKNKSKIGHVRSYNDILQNQKDGKISALLSLEDSQILCESNDAVQKAYNDGVRIAGILWDGENDIGFSYKEDKHLKAVGIEIIKAMEDVGIILDVSHLSDLGLDDILKIAKKPFLASHSNARSLTNHHRNLTDEQIKVISNRGGVIGINFYNRYIDLRRIDDFSESKIEYIAAHIKHIIKCGGENCVAFGQDFDGVPEKSIAKAEIKDASYMPHLFKRLSDYFEYSVLEKIFYKNILNFMMENL
ncbi:MAG: membrane dipeptidase [Alphaproteobacteria bacterium]|nr:membrane dipeptidase [Alphaproteobacteria bacterium]